RPAGEGAARGGDGAVDVGGAGGRDAADDVLGGGIDDVERLVGQRGDPLAADVEPVVGGEGDGHRSSSGGGPRGRRGGGDRLGGAVRERHGRDHRIDATGGPQRAGIGAVHAGRVVQLAPGVRDRGRGVVAHAAAAHLVGREEPEAAGPQRDAL